MYIHAYLCAKEASERIGTIVRWPGNGFRNKRILQQSTPHGQPQGKCRRQKNGVWTIHPIHEAQTLC